MVSSLTRLTRNYHQTSIALQTRIRACEIITWSSSVQCKFFGFNVSRDVPWSVNMDDDEHRWGVVTQHLVRVVPWTVNMGDDERRWGVVTLLCNI